MATGKVDADFIILGYSSSHCGGMVGLRLTCFLETGCFIRLSSYFFSFSLIQLPSSPVSFPFSPCRELPFSCSVTSTEPFHTPFSSASCLPRASIPTHSCTVNFATLSETRAEWILLLFHLNLFCLFLRSLQFHLQFFQLQRHSPFFERE